ncbi:hypothetical protein ACJ41O_014168 [Fusarium nematophilum]
MDDDFDEPVSPVSPPPELEEPETGSPRFVVCFDYGTTYSGVAWALTNGSDATTLEDIQVVKNWAPDYIEPKVPSLYTYSPTQGRKWGHGIGDSPHVVRWSKLELQAPRRIDALRTLRRTIGQAFLLAQIDQGDDSEVPHHITKSPAEVIRAYLVQVARAARRSIEGQRPPHQLKDFPVDIVVTHPAVWDYRARNLTFKAVHSAFQEAFPQSTVGVSHLATEPEACAQYTLAVARSQGLADIQERQCFVVVDAGGGTVDLVSYYVRQLSPFQPQRITNVTGRQCGATRIDEYFLYTYLPQKLGHEYELLAPGGLAAVDKARSGQVVLSRGLQFMLDKFQDIKHSFAGRRHGQSETFEVLDLPEGIGNQNDLSRGILDGQLRISSADLEAMFHSSVKGTIDLIHKQITAVEARRNQVSAIFLSGGFSQSPYLYNRVRQLANGRDIRGVIMGLGLEGKQLEEKHLCPYHIGVVLAEPWAEFAHTMGQRYQDTYDSNMRAKDNIKWIISKGDLIDGTIVKTQKIVKKLTRESNLAGRLKLVFDTNEYIGEYANEPSKSLDYDPDANDNLDRIGYGTRETRDMDYSLPELQEYQRTHGYYTVDMELEVNVSLAGTNCQLMVSRRPEYGEAGHVLNYYHHPFTTSSAVSHDDRSITFSGS